MNKQQAVKRAKTFLRYTATDFPACVEMITEDFVWENYLPPHVPFGGRYERAAGLRKYLDQLSGSWEVGKLLLENFIFDPEARVLVTTGIEKNGRSVPTGRSCDMAFVWEFRFAEDGRLCYLREYNDTAAVGDAFKSGEDHPAGRTSGRNTREC